MLGAKSYIQFFGKGKKPLAFAYFIVLTIIAYIVIFLAIYFWFPPSQNSNGPLRINSITPNSGPTSGSTLVTIDGSGFVPFDQKDTVLLDETFNPGDGPNDSVQTITLQPDGKILIGGGFTQYNGTSRNYIARLNPDGSLDTSFNPGSGANYWVSTIALQPDGKILIGGWFTEYNGTSRNRIARLNADGSLDTTFNLGSGANDPVYAIALQPDGKILISGEFGRYNDIPRNRIARLNSNGSLDFTFNPNKISDGLINKMALQPDGKILIGGEFNLYNKTFSLFGISFDQNNKIFQKHVVRINSDGSLDKTFNLGVDINDSVTAIALQPDGKILIGSYFFNFGVDLDDLNDINDSVTAIVRQGIIRINPTPGTRPPAVIIGENHCTNVVLVSSSQLTCTTPSGTAGEKDVVVINGNGEKATLENGFRYILDNELNISKPKQTSFRIDSITPNSGPTSGGTLVTIDGSGFVPLDQQHYNLDLDPTFNFKKGANGSIFATALQPDGKILIAGLFSEYDGIPTNSIARLNPDGSLDNTFNSKKGVVGSISIIALQSDGKILIGGDFVEYDGTPTNRIARLNPDGSLDTSFNPTRNIHSVKAITLQPDGKILIGGRFTYYNNTPIYRIVRLNPDGSLDTTFNSDNGANNEIYTILLQPDGKILMSGLFIKYNETLRNRIARLNPDGSLDSSFNPNKGANSSVNTIALQPDGKILIGGAFTEYDGTPRNHIARLNPDGSLDSSFDPKKGANSTILAIAPQPDGKILIGGTFARYDDVPRKHLARLNPDGSLDVGFDSENGTNFGIDTIILQSEDKILISGWFNQYKGIPVNRIIRINPTPITKPPTVIIGENHCTNVVLVSSSQLTCTTPSSDTTGKKDVVVINSNGEKAILGKGFTYMTRYPSLVLRSNLKNNY